MLRWRAQLPFVTPLLFVVVFLFSFLFFSGQSSALNQDFYIDCSAPTNGNGTAGNPWNSPLYLFNWQSSSYTFGAGDRVLVRAGTTCDYPIRMIRGSGTSASPVIITSYDTGARPIIDANEVEVDNWDGESNIAAVQLRDFDNVTIEGLELTTGGGSSNEGRRAGVWVLATERYGAHENIIIRDNYIRDILGEYKKNHEATAGINIEQRLPPVAVDPSPTVTWFENILIEDNTIERSNRQGITFWGDWRNRTEDGYNPTGPAWTAWTGVIIRNNTVNDVRGDAIVISNTDGAVIENNTVNGFNQFNGLSEAEILSIRQDAQTKQSLSSLPSRNHAGVWTYNTDNTVIQFNDVRGGVSTRDGMAFDIDGGSVATTIQYNYSQDNEGGFALVCGELGQIRDGIIRYNVSKNDGHASITTCVGEVLNTEIYNNTIYSTDSSVIYPFYQVDWIRFGGDTMTDSRDIALSNNIFYYPNRSIDAFFYNNREGSGIVADQVNVDTTANTNLYSGVAAPTKDASAIAQTPYFSDVSLEASGFQLFSASPGVGAGVAITGDGGRDYAGTVLSSPYNVGAYATTVNDNDGIDDTEEQAGRNGGDGNGDGIPDVVQAHVGSIRSSVTNEYFSLQVLDSGQTSGSPTACRTVQSLDTQAVSVINAADTGNYPLGMIDFTLACSSAGDSADIVIFLDKVYDTSNWQVGKYGSSFEAISGVTLGTRTVGSSQVTTIEYSITDGGSLDEDGVVNGVIVDPIGVAVVAGDLAETGRPLTMTLLFSFGVITAAYLAKSTRTRYHIHSGLK